MADIGAGSDDEGERIQRNGHIKRTKLAPPHPYDIVPIKKKKDDEEDKPIRGAELISEMYPGSVALVAKTKSGKTTIINHILEHCVDDRTRVYIFCSTVEVDPSWIQIVKDLRSRKVGVFTWPEMISGKRPNHVNHLDQLYQRFKMEDDYEKAQKKQKKGLHEISRAPSFFGGPNPVADPENMGVKEKEEKDKERPDRVPKRYVILDDLSIPELHDSSVDTALKKTRHYKARVIISSQHIMHISKTAFGQLTAVLLWRGFSMDYIKSLVDGRLTVPLDYKRFYALYKEMTKEDFAFISVYQSDEQIRFKFDMPPIPLEAIFKEDAFSDPHASSTVPEALPASRTPSRKKAR